MSHLDILKNWYDRVWIGGDIAAIPEFFPEDSAANGLLPDLSLTPRDFAEFIPAMQAVVQDMHYEILRHIETEDWLWALVRFHGYARRNAAPVDMTSQVAVRIANGQFVEAHNTTDMLQFFEQIRALPQNAMALLLSGEQLN
ncbi:hypothetical protein CKO11_03140 [Rhodobacter sp. TJ_12]|uniref:nuclear transport factor 2 family protein n=1 Tax=Rhodobacter sp. TJ_12 TaxID=2029399 RepID=UPI001CBC5A0A|nr:nuclear transport factor 2 family protein [Rhodobacter sp. TJ_12]MBZ4021459.1 hypothetical protein [Rhodobacter sp. TJ_12]